MALGAGDNKDLAALEQIIAGLEGDMKRIAALFDQLTAKRLELFARATGEAVSESQRIELAKALERDLNKIANRLYGPKSEFHALFRKAAVQSAMNGKARLYAIMSEAEGVAMRGLAQRDVAQIIKASRDSYELAARNLGEDAVAEIRQLVTRELMQGAGEKRLTQALMDKGYIPDLEKGGRVIKAQTRAEMIARTEPRRVNQAAYQESAAEVEPSPALRLWKWVSVLGATSGEDSFRRHGLVMTEEEWNNHDFGDGMYGLPPIRPNDRCSAIFMREQWLDGASRKALSSPAGSDARRFTQAGEEAKRLQALNQ